MIVLNENKNIINYQKQLFLYDDSFNNSKLIDSKSGLLTSKLKINDNSFVYTNNVQNGIFLATIENNYFNKTKIEDNSTSLLCFLESEKILFSYDNNYIYLINFKTIIPEMFQKINMKNEKFYCSFNLIKNIFYVSYEKTINKYLSFYENKYNSLYKLLNGEFIEISEIEIQSKEIEE